MHLTAEQEPMLKDSTICHICNEEWGADILRDHNHLTVKYRAAATIAVIGTSERTYFVLIIFQNLKGYDAHHIMSAIGQFKNERLTCIFNNMENTSHFPWVIYAS